MKDWKAITGLGVTAVLLIALAMFVGCDDYGSTDKERFRKVGGFEADGENCLVRVIEDRQTGCQYILACNAISPMPHTCFLDKANDSKVGN